jgi:hypothetical protein
MRLLSIAISIFCMTMCLTVQPSMALGGVVLTHSMYSGGTHARWPKSKKSVKHSKKAQMQTASTKDARGNAVSPKATDDNSNPAPESAGMQPAEASGTPDHK